MAEDLVQQTFLQWAKKGHLLRDATKVKTWLFTTLYREYLGIARHEKRHQHVKFEPDLHGSTQNEDDTNPPRVDNVTLQFALDQLVPNHRAPLVLFYLRELSYHDISEALNIPIGTVMSRISRAKAALRVILLRTEKATINGIHPRQMRLAKHEGANCRLQGRHAAVPV
jgi:RNA polymerase sigma-70 factor (ECF subfamily)